MKLQAILHVKGTEVYSISPRANLEDVVEKLVDCKCGSLIVGEDGELIGIITERDILRACAVKPDSLLETPVADHMTTDVITGSLEDEVEDIMGLMTKNRIRHLPILENGRLAGVISIGDVVKAQHDALTIENHYLKEYLHG